MLNSARARTNAILEGKCGSRRQSTTSFSENVVVVKAGYQILEILKFSIATGSGLNQVLTSFNGNKPANFGGQKSTMMLSGGVYFGE